MTGISKFQATSRPRTAWTSLTLVNSWATVSGRTPSYHKDALGYVHLRGTMSGGASGTLAFTLPVGFRTGMFASALTASATPNAPGVLNLDTNGQGTVFFTAGAGIASLDNVAPFLAEN